MLQAADLVICGIIADMVLQTESAHHQLVYCWTPPRQLVMRVADTVGS